MKTSVLNSNHLHLLLTRHFIGFSVGRGPRGAHSARCRGRRDRAGRGRRGRVKPWSELSLKHGSVDGPHVSWFLAPLCEPLDRVGMYIYMKYAKQFCRCRIWTLCSHYLNVWNKKCIHRISDDWRTRIQGEQQANRQTEKIKTKNKTECGNPAVPPSESACCCLSPSVDQPRSLRNTDRIHFDHIGRVKHTVGVTAATQRARTQRRCGCGLVGTERHWCRRSQRTQSRANHRTMSKMISHI